VVLAGDGDVGLHIAAPFEDSTNLCGGFCCAAKERYFLFEQYI
jgi:hypothetical protein